VSDSPAVVLYDANGVAMAVENGVAVPAGTRALLIAGSDGTNIRFVKVTAAGRAVTDGSEVTQPISAAALPLPAGAATSANQTTELSSLASILAQLDVALSTRASQATLADVKAKTDNLDVALSTRASQTTVASILTQLDVALSTRASQTTAAAIETILAAIRDTAGIKKITDQLPTGTNTIGKTDQGLANTAANRWPFYLTDGSNSMPMGDAIARAIYHLITDGTNGPVAVKAPSTAPVAADKALVTVLSPNQTPIPVTTSPSSATAASRTGYAILGGGTSGSFNAIRAAVYNEQAANATRSVASANANDTSAGTGARTVEITYYDSTGEGPFTTTVTLNGVTAVATSVSNICFVESVVVKTVGSGGANAGIITLYVNNAGGGGTIGTIAVGSFVAGVGDNRTLWGHHYVATGKTMSLTNIVCGASATTTFLLRSKNPTNANAPETFVNGSLISTLSEFRREFPSPAAIVGPARVTAYGIPSTNNVTLNLSFDFYES
jgi:hypothetical protein